MGRCLPCWRPVFVLWHGARNPADKSARQRQFSLFTNWEGNEEGAEISPNASSWRSSPTVRGEFDLWVNQVGTDNFFNLTAGLPPLVGSGFIVRKLGFTADSAEIWFNAGDGKPPARIPVTGHALPKPFLPVGTNTPAWSPDGKSLVSIYKANRDDPMHLRDASGADPHEILGPGPLKNMNPVFSLDNKWIYFGRSIEPQDETEMDVWRLSPSGGTPERITRQHLAINFLGAARSAPDAVRGARRRSFRSMAVVSRRQTRNFDTRAHRQRPVHVGIRQPRRAQDRCNGRQSEREFVGGPVA